MLGIIRQEPIGEEAEAESEEERAGAERVVSGAFPHTQAASRFHEMFKHPFTSIFKCRILRGDTRFTSDSCTMNNLRFGF